MLFGNTQQPSLIGTNDDVILDLGSDPYHVQGNQASGLMQMPLDPMVGSPDSSILAAFDPNLAFLDATTDHPSSMTNVTMQAGPSATAITSSRSGRLTRHQILIREARGFLENTAGNIRTTPSSSSFSSQPSPLSVNLSTESIRNASSQVVTANHPIISPRRTRNSHK